MSHLSQDKKKLFLENNVHSIKENVAECKIENKIVYYILDQICKYTNVHPSVKQHKSKRDGRVTFYAIHSRWLGQNDVNATASEDELALQMLTHNGEKKTWTWEKYVS